MTQPKAAEDTLRPGHVPAQIVNIKIVPRSGPGRRRPRTEETQVQDGADPGSGWRRPRSRMEETQARDGGDPGRMWFSLCPCLVKQAPVHILILFFSNDLFNVLLFLFGSSWYTCIFKAHYDVYVLTQWLNNTSHFPRNPIFPLVSSALCWPTLTEHHSVNNVLTQIWKRQIRLVSDLHF